MMVRRHNSCCLLGFPPGALCVEQHHTRLWLGGQQCQPKQTILLLFTTGPAQEEGLLLSEGVCHTSTRAPTRIQSRGHHSTQTAFSVTVELQVIRLIHDGIMGTGNLSDTLRCVSVSLRHHAGLESLECCETPTPNADMHIASW